MFDIKDDSTTIALIVCIICLDLYFISVSYRNRDVSFTAKNAVIKDDTTLSFNTYLNEFRMLSSNRMDYSGSNSSSSYSNNNNNWGMAHTDDQWDFLDGNTFGTLSTGEDNTPTVPSSQYMCDRGYISIRSELNYKYIWMHHGDTTWMGASATMDTPIHHKAFEIIPVDDCVGNSGWVLLKATDAVGYLIMNVPDTYSVTYNNTYHNISIDTVSDNKQVLMNDWVVEAGTTDITHAKINYKYHYLLEEAGYVLNRDGVAFINVITGSDYAIRGHAAAWDKAKPAKREYGAMVNYQIVTQADVTAAIDEEKKEVKDADEQDAINIMKISSLPSSTEKRVISFGLYGTNDKYINGAIKNVELAKVYFPGWICRYYVANDVPALVLDQLREGGAEIVDIPVDMGYASGMFWRFMVASDDTVDRYIIRDVDSRLNARDRLAVQEWIDSKYPIHILRDHINHCITMNGGMWGGIKGVLSNMKRLVGDWTDRDAYAADLKFLAEQVWPLVQDKQMSHDSYCCDRFPNTRPYPTRRPLTYQHVGQVFDKNNNPRLNDIDGFIRGVPIPSACRKSPDWIFG